MKFCPCCFLDKRIVPLKLIDGLYDCKKCGYTFTQTSTLISEDTVRVFIQENKPKFDGWLEKLGA
jgi:uncharacterized Zn finger protein